MKTIPIYPEARGCPSPSAERVLDLFEHVNRHVLIKDGVVLDFEPTLTPLQSELLRLLGIPTSAYGCG